MRKFEHPYNLKTARWIRKHLILQKDKGKRKQFLESLEDVFGSRYAEMLRYISNDYRVMIRDDQMWSDFDSEDWVGAVWSCGRAYGKALRNDQLVKTPNGWIPIGEISVGDKVLDRKSGLQRVEAVYPQGVVKLFNIEASDGRTSVACKDHLWTGFIGNQLRPEGDSVTLKTSEIVDLLKKGKRFYLPKISGQEDFKEFSEFKIDPYVLGLLIGDANMSQRHVAISTADQEILNAIEDVGYKVNHWSNYDYGVTGATTAIREIGLLGKTSHTKFIPEEYFEGNYQQRVALIQGLMDTDGTANRISGALEFSTVSEQLAKDFQKLCWSIGGSCKIVDRKTKCNGKEFSSFRVTLQLHENVEPFRLARKKKNYKHREVHNYVRITSYSEAKSAEATCITVSGDESLFITNNYLVTHNTWAGSPACIEYAMQHPNSRIGLIAPTFGMGRTNMIEGSSGIIKLSPKGFKPKYNRSDGTLTWPNGATAKLFSAENGDRIRGENFNYIWVDEFCFCKFTGQDDDFWKMAKMALRAGNCPKYTITTSPRPIKALRELYELSKRPNSNVLFHTGTTFDNYSLPQSFIDEIKLDEGTSLYNQEVLGMILEENAGAIFTNENILRVELDAHGEDPDKYNDRLEKLINSMDSIVVGVDPNVVEDISSDETGIVICGRKNDKGYVFKDASSRGKIKDVYRTVVKMYYRYNADAVVVETNNGGDFIPAAIYNIDPMVVVEKVFASRGKRARAEPIGLLYERQKIYHVGIHQDLEVQMTDYNPQVHTKSPDRMDALVWAFTKLFPASMRGLFNTESVAEVYKSPKKKHEVTDLYEDFYKQAEQDNDPYNLHNSDEDMEDSLVYI